MRYRLDGVIAVVDAVNAAATLDAHMESVKQVAVADRIVLTKTDLLTTAQGRRDRKALTARLHMLNPAAPVLDAAANEATPERLLACGLFDPARKHPDVKRWLAAEAYADADHRHHGHHHDVNRHDDRVRAFSFASEAAMPAATFDMFLDLLLAARSQPAAPQGHREACGDPGDPRCRSRRAARLTSGGAAAALARRR